MTTTIFLIMTALITIASIIVTRWWQQNITTAKVAEIKCETWVKINIIRTKSIYCAHIPEGTVSVGVTVELLKEDEERYGRCVLLVKGYKLLDSVSI